jgi:hypothetical protein
LQDLYTSTAPGYRFDNYNSCYFRRLDEPFYPFYRIPLNLDRVLSSIHKNYDMKKSIIILGIGVLNLTSLTAHGKDFNNNENEPLRPRPRNKTQIQNQRDRREDIRDRREDRRDRREDIRDARFQGGPRDRREDIRDRREDVRDKREDKRDRRRR